MLTHPRNTDWWRNTLNEKSGFNLIVTQSTSKAPVSINDNLYTKYFSDHENPLLEKKSIHNSQCNGKTAFVISNNWLRSGQFHRVHKKCKLRKIWFILIPQNHIHWYINKLTSALMLCNTSRSCEYDIICNYIVAYFCDIIMF